MKTKTKTAYIEEWKPVPKYEGKYEVSSLGNVRSIDRAIVDLNGLKLFKNGRVLRQIITPRGYYQVTLTGDRSYQKPIPVHKLVALAFLPFIDGKTDIDHINGDKSDNRSDNLRRVSRSENNLNKNSKGVYKQRNGRWQAKIEKDYKKYYIGSFNTFEEAKKARIDFENQIFPNINRRRQ